MNKDPFHQIWSASKRNSMEMRQQNGRAMVLRQLDELDAKARALNESVPDTLELNPDVQVPRYQAAVDIHCMPGSYHGEERPGDVSAGANYDCGIFATTAGGLGALSDGGGAATYSEPPSTPLVEGTASALRGSMATTTADSSMCAGGGDWTRMP